MLPLAGILWAVLGQGDHLDHRNTSGTEAALGLHPHLMSVPSGGGGIEGSIFIGGGRAVLPVCLVKITLSASCCLKLTQLYLFVHSG